MIKVNKLGILLSKTDRSFECDGVLNPGVIKVGKTIHVFYRAVAKGNFSTIGYCTLSSPTEVETRHEEPLLVPQAAYEFQGLEDPRVVQIEDTIYMSYTAYDGHNALGALATSKDFIHWFKHGIIVPQITYEEFKSLTQSGDDIPEKYERYNDYSTSHDKQGRLLFLWDKNLILFPRKIKEQFYFLHRIKPDIQIIVAVKSLEDLTTAFWKKYFAHFEDYIVLAPKYEHEVSYIGCGCPPIETEIGWLLIYHGVHDTIHGYVYSACAALLDVENPGKEIARLPYPLFFPEKEWELKGEVNNVCFPTGAIVENDVLFIYYGAADERIAIASLSLPELLLELKQYII